MVEFWELANILQPEMLGGYRLLQSQEHPLLYKYPSGHEITDAVAP